MIPVKNLLIGTAAVAGVATVAGNLTSMPGDAHKAAEQAYYADDPTELSPTYGGVLPGQTPLIRTLSQQAAPQPQPSTSGQAIKLSTLQNSPRPPSDRRSPDDAAPPYGGALSTIPLDQIAPNLSQLAAPRESVGDMIPSTLTGIPELDSVLKNGAVSVSQMVDALRQSGHRVARMAPGNTTEYVLRCLSNFNDPGCAGIRNEVNVLHTEMTRIGAGIIETP